MPNVRSLSALVLVSLASPAGAVDLTGQSVNATFTPASFSSNVVQFTSPQTVGAGVEFTGSFTDSFQQAWRLALDVGAAGFTLDIADGLNGNIKDGAGSALKIDLSNLSGIGALTLTSYSCSAPGGFACGTFNGGPNIASSGFDVNSATVTLDTIRNGERYVFALGLVPEPASWALMIGGFALAGAALRRRQTRGSFA